MVWLMAWTAKILSFIGLDEAAHAKSVIAQRDLIMCRSEILVLAQVVLLIIFPLQLQFHTELGSGLLCADLRQH